MGQKTQKQKTQVDFSHLLFELGVDRQHLRVTNKGESQDWDGVRCLQAKDSKDQ